MPFTPAHAVVALPFVRSPLVPAAIAIGAMTPDVPLFFRVGIDYWLTHSWLGVVTVDLALALGLTLLWWLVLRRAVPSLVPRWVAERLPASWTAPTPWRSRITVPAAAVLVISLILGSATHLLWDEVTHDGRWGSSVLPAWNEEFAGITGWHWMQYASSAAGLVILAIWMIRWLRRRQPHPIMPAISPRQAVLLWMTVPLALVAGVGIVAAVRGLPDDGTGVRELLARGGTVGGAVILVIFGVVSAVITTRLHVRHARDVPKFAGPPTST